MVMRKSFFIFLLTPVLVFAQQRPEEGVWMTLNMPLDVSAKWQIHNDASYRTLSVAPDPLQYLYRTGLRYHFNEKYSATAGVAFFFTRTSFNKDNEEFGNEFRTWQEFQSLQKLNQSDLIQIRFRSEQRFFEATQRRDAFAAHRIRLRAALNKQLSTRWSLVLADEYMQQYAFDDFVFDQNRVIGSMVYNFSENSQLQFGYMWLLWPQESSQHLLNITFQKRIQLYGKN
jgi:long-subunit fatty acid transport protein